MQVFLALNFQGSSPCRPEGGWGSFVEEAFALFIWFLLQEDCEGGRKRSVNILECTLLLSFQRGRY